MNVPDAAIEAAAEAVTAHYDEPAGSCRGIGFCNEIVARAAVEAAMPAIREWIAAEEFDPYDDYLHYSDAARIVRGGTP